MRSLFTAVVSLLLLACSPATLAPRPVQTSLLAICPRCLPENAAVWQPVMTQYYAYNSNDLERFLRSYGDDVTVREQPSGQVVVPDKASMRTFYQKLFATQPTSNWDVSQRLVSGEWVFEHGTVGSGQGAFDTVIAYRVKDGRIVEVWHFPHGTEGRALDQVVSAPVQEQLEAYNARDLERFLRPYADDVTLRGQPEGTVIASDKAAMRPLYARGFAKVPPVVCDMRARLVSGEWVFDHEFFGSGHDGFDAVAAYHVKAGAIVEVWFFPRSRLKESSARVVRP